MSGGDGIGEAASGSLFARAAEPLAGESVAEREGECLNCGARLDGPYCRMCGQSGHVHRTLSAIGHELLHGVLHLDGKFWRTLPLLASRPGELTRRYVDGERAKFVSPLGMFLFAIFLMFAVLQVYGLSLSRLDSVGATQIQRGMDQARAEMVEDLEELREGRAAVVRGEVVRYRGSPQTVAQIDARLARTRTEIEELDQVRRQAERLRIGTNVTGRSNLGWGWVDKGLRKFNDNPSLALYKLQANGYKFSWLLIPLSVPFVWLLFFWTRRFRFYDHTVFVTYSLAFMSLLAVILTVLGFLGAPEQILVLAAIFVPPFHIFRQLKGAYRLGWFGAIVRTVVLVNFCFLTAALFFVLLLGLGALG